jgi:V-type H+-transporting ATPase subunit a
VWSLSSNRLSLVNNIKMKISVIMGVIHMSLGIFCKGTNSIYFGNYTIFFTEVFAGLVILLGLFGWMDALIIAKWFHHIDLEDNTPAPAALGRQIPFETEDEYSNGTYS